MGTRHLTCVVLNKEYKVAQYGQWDGYPKGQGLDILNFLTKEFDREKFTKNLNENVHYVSDEYVSKTYEECGAEKDAQFVNMNISDKHKVLYPELSRDTGSKILKMIQDTEKPLGIVDSLPFAKDSLFCEYAYVIDLDKNTLEVYNGFNEEPLKEEERFFEMNKDVAPDEKYFLEKLLCSFDLLTLPTEEEFIKVCEEAETDETRSIVICTQIGTVGFL